MRHIGSHEPPEALIRACADRRAANQPLDYDEISQVVVDGREVTVKTAIRQKRLEDQGYLCAYTMMRIDMESCHNEHLIPRQTSKASLRVEETLDYANIVACYPNREVKGGCGFGATARGTQPLVLKPTDPSCEVRLQFERHSGMVKPSQPSDLALANQLESVLCLNHPYLVDHRKRAYAEAGVGVDSRNPLSAAQARRLARNVINYRRGQRLAPFCAAIAQAALAHAHLAERRSRLKAARAAANRAT